MATELLLRYADLAALKADFESNLQKGRAFVPGASGLREREFCTLHIEHPSDATRLSLRAEAVWIHPDPTQGGIGVEFIDFGKLEREALNAFVAARRGDPATAETGEALASDSGSTAQADATGETEIESESTAEPDSEGTPSVRNLHDRVRDLSLNDREALARQGTLPERVALERRYGSSVWEGLLHNPQLTPREVVRLAKSTSLPATLVNLIVANKGWLADTAIQAALLANPRVSGAHLDRVLRALPQNELARVAEQTSLRMLVRTGAKKLIRR